MKVKTFHALTMQDALRAIKEELGPDAIILSSKEVREGGRLLRVFNHTVLEVMAAAEYERPQVARESAQVQESVPPVRTSGAGPSALHPVNTFQQTLRGMLEPISEKQPRKQLQQELSRKHAISTGTPNQRRKVRAVYDELRQLLHELSPDACPTGAGQLSPVLSTLRQSLCDQGM
ncbi:MAG TPA: hypothetical protein DEA71_04480, partial [Nitrospira sp.]|nr:hypothetical protein [Nitrospira sp.]